MATIKEILVDCISEALGLPRDPIATDVRDVALSACNAQGRIIFDAWSWDNCKLDEFTAPTANSDGIITFAANVSEIRAIRAIAAGQTVGSRVWNQDDLLATVEGEQVASDRFVYLSDSPTGCRRIQLPSADAASNTYKVLAFKRYVNAIVDPAYDVGAPGDTPTDYRVATFAIDRAEPALREFIKDALRVWADQAPMGQGSGLLKLARDRQENAQDREHRYNPAAPMFEEVGSICGD